MPGAAPPAEHDGFEALYPVDESAGPRMDVPRIKHHSVHGIIGVRLPDAPVDIAHPVGGRHAGELGYVALKPLTIHSPEHGERKLDAGDLLLPEELEAGDHGDWVARLVRTHMVAALPLDRGVLGLLRLLRGDDV
jgi:hypothetical protein